MKVFQSLLFLLCFSSVLIFSCQKEPSDQPQEPVARFDLEASDAACKALSINGSFIEGKSLTSNESIQLEIFITKVGKWSFSSDTVNGFSFSGNGNFTDTGKHTITLNASGTPTKVGNYVFSMTKGSVKRSVSVPVLKEGVAMETVPLKSYFKGTIGGVQYYIEAPTIGPDNIPYGRGGGDTASFSSFVGPRIFPQPPGTGTASLQKNFLYHYKTSTEADFKNFFKPGAYAFSAKKCTDNISHGIIFSWADSNTEFWVSLNDLADQTGSAFVIVGMEDGHDSQGHYFVKVKSKFNCRLYNLKTGEMKELTDGELVSFFIK